jgi:glycosyltransferase involved in cell wall biosynthesis
MVFVDDWVPLGTSGIIIQMKILQAFDFFSLPHGGGVVDLLYSLSKALKQRGHEVTVYASDFELDQEYIDSLSGVEVYPFHSWFHVSGIHVMPGIIAETKEKLRDFDIIHLHAFRSFQNVVIYHYAGKYGIPYIMDAHGAILRIGRGNRGLKQLLKWIYDVSFGNRILRGAGKVIAQNETEAGQYLEAGVSQGKIVQLPLPFATAEFARLPSAGLFRRRFNIEQEHIILYLGRIHWIKGLDFLIESFHELTKLRNDVVLAVVGADDGYRGSLEKLIDRLNLSNRVIFTGFLGGEDKLSAMVDADVLVQTSVYEQSSKTPFEAILCGTPVIVSRNTGAGEDVVRIDAGYLVEYGRKNELADRIQHILDNPGEAQIKTQKAKKYIEANLSLAGQAEKYEKLYQEVADMSRK